MKPCSIFASLISSGNIHPYFSDRLLSFPDDGHYEAEVLKDSVNANRQAFDYKREVGKVVKNNK